MSDSVIEIGTSAFDACPLQNVKLSNNLKTMSDSVF